MVPETLQYKQFELANTPMKTELYLGLDVDKEWIVIAVAEWGRNGPVHENKLSHRSGGAAGKQREETK